MTTENAKIMKLGVLVPSMGLWRAEFGGCLAGLCGHVAARHVPGFSLGALRLFTEESSMLPCTRQRLVTRALDDGMTHLLFLDSDMVFPHDALQRLASHKKEIVLCNYSRKKRPPQSTAGVMHEDGRIYMLEPDNDITGLQQVTGGGLGLALVEASVFEELPKPWFQFGYCHEDGSWLGEDYYFFMQAKNSGFNVYCDMDLSREVGHVGACNYTLGGAA